MDEFEFIDHIKQRTYKQNSVVKGIGDDAAIFRPTTNDVVTAVDTFVENIHFTSKTTTPFHVGYRALAANISDIAAMGAVPKFYLVSIVVPSEIGEETLLQMYAGMNDIAKNYQMDLIGGDTVSGEQLVISITVIGYLSTQIARYRSNAKENDVVFVTGVLGDSAAGLHILLNELSVKDGSYFINRHQMPEPRVSFVEKLQSVKRIALNDVSDGIANELRELAVASDKDIIVHDEMIPIHPSLKQFNSEHQYRWKYFGGEDFELVGTVGNRDWFDLEKIAQEIGLKITKIGNVTLKQAKHPQVLLWKENSLSLLKNEGYIHLK